MHYCKHKTCHILQLLPDSCHILILQAACLSLHAVRDLETQKLHALHYPFKHLH